VIEVLEVLVVSQKARSTIRCIKTLLSSGPAGRYLCVRKHGAP